MKSHSMVLTSLVFILVGTTSSQAQWVNASSLYGGYFRALAASGTTVFAGGTASGFFVSTNAGTSWIKRGMEHSCITAIAVRQNDASEANIFVGADMKDNIRGVILSTDYGQTWTQKNSGLNSLNVSALLLYPNDTSGVTLFVGTWDDGIYRSTNNGSSWTRSDSGMTEPNVWALAVAADGKGAVNLIAGTSRGIFFSVNDGQSWTPKDTGMTEKNIYSLKVLHTGADSIVLLAGAWNGEIFRSTNMGSSWLRSDSGLTYTDEIPGSSASPPISSFSVVSDTSGDTKIFVATNGGGVFVSTNNGTSWTAVKQGLTFPYVTSLAAVPDGSGGTNLFAGTWGDGIYLSSDGGLTWSPVDSGLVVRNVTTLAKNPKPSGDTILFAGTYGGGIFYSTDEGTTWNRDNLGVDAFVVNALALYADGEGETKILLGGVGLFISTNGGVSWNRFNSITANIRAFAVFNNDTIGTKILAGGLEWGIPNTGEVFLSSDYGKNWSQIGTKLIVQDFVALAAYDSLIFAGTPNGVFLSTDGCVTWSRQNTGLTDTGVTAFILLRGATENTNLLACTRSGLFLSTDNGLSWAFVGSDSVITQTNALLEFRSSLFAGTLSGVWKRPISELVTSVVSKSDLKRKTFDLQQNYPNPFNPSTTISFTLPLRSFVTLKVFDLLGREVSTIVSEEMSAGTYSRKWNAWDKPSGVYFYRLQAGSYRETKKVLVLK